MLIKVVLPAPLGSRPGQELALLDIQGHTVEREKACLCLAALPGVLGDGYDLETASKRNSGHGSRRVYPAKPSALV